jgi:subtilisin family serine protease
MSDRFLVTRKRTRARVAGGGPEGPFMAGAAAAADPGSMRAEVEGAASGVTVEHMAREGAIVRISSSAESDTQPQAVLEGSGFRVKHFPETELIRVGEFVIDTEKEPGAETDPPVPPDLTLPPDEEESWPHHLVQLIAPPSLEWVDRIEAQGVDVIEPVSRYALFVCAPPERVHALRGLKMPDDEPDAESFVAWTGPFLPAYRLSSETLRLRDGAGPVQYLRIGVAPADRVEGVEARIGEWGGEVVQRWEETGKYNDRIAFLLAELDASRISSLAQLPFVRLIERHEALLSSEDERATQILAHAFDGATPPNTAPIPGYTASLAGFGLNGEGVIVGVCDTGVDTNDDSTLHPDLRGRLAFFQDVTGGRALVDKKGHGTHVAGIAVGDGSSNADEPGPWRLGQGVAPRARLGVINPVDTPGSPGLRPLGNYTRLMVSHGAQIMNNSWREGTETGYTAGAALADRLVRDPNGDGGADPARNYLVLVFSAGNQGESGDRTITHPKEAKNPIIVGNSRNRRSSGDDIRGIASTSSRGPAQDGRILPTIVAPGQDIVSARSATANPFYSSFTDSDEEVHEQHTEQSGTSMAAAHVSGACALLIQRWRQQNDSLPSPALLKAWLINGAEDLAGGPDGRGGTLAHIPNNDQGWGRVCLNNLLRDHPLSDRGPRLSYDQNPARALFASGDERIFTVRPSRPGVPLRVTLVWTDPPGAAGATPALVNDLDLEVTEVVDGQESAVYKGNLFVDGFSLPDEGDFDSLNNVECVYVREPRENAIYEVRVIASTLSQNALPPFTGPAFQDFALVIDNAVEEEPPF